jgi:hypothetical protein
MQLQHALCFELWLVVRWLQLNRPPHPFICYLLYTTGLVLHFHISNVRAESWLANRNQTRIGISVLKMVTSSARRMCR